MQITEEDQLGDLLCWVRMARHMLLMKLSLTEVALMNGGAGPEGQGRRQTIIIWKYITFIHNMERVGFLP